MKGYTDESYESLVRAVADNVCIKHYKPIIADYEEEVAEYICEVKHYAPGTYTKRQVHSSVFTTIKAMAERGELVSEGKYYWTPEAYDRYTGKEIFIRNVKTTKDSVCMISDNAIAIQLSQDADKDLAKQAAISFIGEEIIYSIFICENTLIILYEMFADINLVQLNNAMKDAYKYHNGKKKTS